MGPLLLLLPPLAALAITPAIAASRSHNADAVIMNTTQSDATFHEAYLGEAVNGEGLQALRLAPDDDGPDWNLLEQLCGPWDVPNRYNPAHHPRAWWKPDWIEEIDYNWWPPHHPPYYKAPHYWVNQVTGHVREYPCGRPMYRTTMHVQNKDIPSLSYQDYFTWPTPKEYGDWDLMRHPRNNRVMWQHIKNKTVRWTDPLIPHRWWSQWTDGEGKPFWLNDFTQETTTEEPFNANWSITLRNSYGCDDDGAVIGVINHPIVNGCYPLDMHGKFNLGSADDENSFRYQGSFTVYPGPCKIRVFQTAGCPTEDVAWLTHDPSKRWHRAGRWASVKPEEGAKCFKVNEAQYAFDNTSGTMSVPVEWRRRFCHGDAELDDPRLPQAPEWPAGLGDDIRELMGVRWGAWLDRQWELGADRNGAFGSWLVGEVGCRKNAESANIQKRLSRPFAPSVQVMCPEDDISQWWRRDREP